MIQVELSRILIAETRQEQVIILKEINGSRSFPIIIGIYEAAALDRKVKNMKAARPLTHDLIENIIRGFNASLGSVVVHQLKNDTFYAKLLLQINGKALEIDSRPSDAIVLAVQLNAPIYVEEKVIDAVAGSPLKPEGKTQGEVEEEPKKETEPQDESEEKD